MQVRDSTAEDVAAIAAIYGHHVLHGVASFELETPSEKEIDRRRAAILEEDLPHLVADREGVVIGFAYAGPYRARPAYHHTVENSVYVDPDYLGLGVGRTLLGALITRCREAGRREMIAIIGDSDNRASIALHMAMGFRHTGTFENVGFKHGRWLDSALMQRSLTESDAP